jgi:HlyD family secretion protein
VSHLEGGILAELLVRDGDRVAAGQVLLRLDDTQARALVGQVRGQMWAATARVARLRAEQAGERQFALPPELEAAARQDSAAAATAEAEQKLFATRWESYDGTQAVHKKQIAQLQQQVSAIQSQAAATQDRLAYTQEELATVKGLLAKGYERKPRVLELQRLTAELRGTVGELRAKEAEARQAIAQGELEMLNLENTRRTEVSDELQRAQTEAGDLIQRLKSAEDLLARLTVLAPQAGRVTELRFFTPGSAIPAGSPILDLVPQDDELVVEAAVQPTDIDNVHGGQPAQVRLTAYKQRKVPPIGGEVAWVAPDLTRDEHSGQAYYVARVRLSASDLHRLEGVELYPGMPAEVMIEGSRRRAIDYFTSPITDTLHKAFREE